MSSKGMKPIRLEEICPEFGEFTLQATGKTYRLRKVTVDDESWLKTKFGPELEDILKKLDVQKLAPVFFRLLEDKTDFMPCTIEELDDEGASMVKRTLTGPQHLLYKITGMQEKIAVCVAFLKTMGFSRPLEDLKEVLPEDSQAEVKKNESLVGETSLTGLPDSTVTPLIKSAG